MFKKRIDLINEELEECNLIILRLNLEKDICLATHELNSINEIVDEIKSINKRKQALEIILESENNPSTDFLSILEIKG